MVYLKSFGSVPERAGKDALCSVRAEREVSPLNVKEVSDWRLATKAGNVPLMRVCSTLNLSSLGRALMGSGILPGGREGACVCAGGVRQGCVD